MKPVVDGLRQRYTGRIDFMVYATLESDGAGGAFANSKGVRAVPTMMLVAADGTELQRWVGAVGEERISGAFDDELAR